MEIFVFQLPWAGRILPTIDPFVNVLHLVTCLYMLCVFVCTPLHGQSDSCWIAIVINFNTNWTALPTRGCHRLLVECNFKVQEAWNGLQYKRSTKS